MAQAVRLRSKETMRGVIHADRGRASFTDARYHSVEFQPQHDQAPPIACTACTMTESSMLIQSEVIRGMSINLKLGCLYNRHGGLSSPWIVKTKTVLLEQLREQLIDRN